MMRFHPTVEIPPWPPSDDPTATNPSSPYCIHEALSAFQRYLPSNSPDNPDSPIDAYSCDSFRMYEFKVRRCIRGRSHDWTECPYAHPGEKARRRDPRKYNYSGTACQEFRKGCCSKGDACEFAHGVFECWLHPARYRTQACKDGQNCRRRVCFFAHSADQLRVLSDSPLSSPPMSSFDSSPPESPMELSRSLGSLQLGGGGGKGKTLANSWGFGVGTEMHVGGSISRGGFCSLPSTPTRCVSNRNGGFDGVWVGEEEPVMERVESGRDLRMKMFERISKGSCLDPVDPDPDVGWVSDLLK